MARESIGQLVVRLGLDAAEYTAGIDRAEFQAKKMARAIDQGVSAAAGALKVLGVAAVAAGAVAVKMGLDFIGAAADLDDLAEKTGASVEELSRLTQQARISGQDFGTVEQALIQLAKSLNSSDEEAKKATRALSALGLKAADLKNLDTAQTLRLIAARMNEFGDGTGKTALAMDLFKKSGAQVLPILKDLANDTQAATTVTREQAAAAEELGKQWRGLLNDVRNLGQAIAIDLVPFLSDLISKFNAARTATGNFASGINAVLQLEVGRFGSTFEEQIKNIDQKLADLEKHKKLFAGAAFTQGIFGIRESALLDIKATAQALRALKKEAADVEDAAFGVPGKKPIDYKQLPDIKSANTAANAAAEALKRLEDQRAKQAVDSAKSLAQARLSILDAYYATGIMKEEEYWSTRTTIQETAFQQELAALNAQIQRETQAQDVARRSGTASKAYSDATRDLEETLARRNKLEQDFARDATLAYFQRQKATESYKRSIEEVNIRLLELQGNTVAAARAQAELSTRELFKEAVSRDDTSAQAAIQRQRELIVIQAQYNAEREKLEAINTRLGIEEERIQNSLRVGAISELEALRRTEELRKRQIAQQEEIVRNLDEIARASGNPALILQAEQARAALERLRTETNLLEQKFNTIFEDALADSFTDFITGAKSAKEAMNDFANSVVSQINRIIAQDLAKRMFGGAGGFGSIIAGLFGSGAGAGGAGAFAGVAASAGASFAVGTPYVPRDMFAKIHKGEAIIPANENKWGRSVNVSVVQNFPQGTSRETVNQAATRAGLAVQRAIARNG